MHTPGPWQYLAKLSGSENHKGYRIVCEANGRWWIADSSPIDQDGKEGEANARLIAAAPELLDALQAMVKVMDRGPKPEKLDAALTWRQNDELARLLADTAIAKALGGQR